MSSLAAMKKCLGRTGVVLVVCWLGWGSVARAAFYAGEPMPFLRGGVGARAMALGNAGTADGANATATYWNPAHLTFLSNDSFAAQTVAMSQERTWQFVGYGHPGVTASGLPFAYGASWINFSCAGIEHRDENWPQPERSFADNQSVWTVSGSMGLVPQGGLGINAKILMHTLDDDAASGLGFDLGWWQQIDQDLRWGLVMQDFYSTLSWPANRLQERLPSSARLGAAYEIFPGQLTVMVDMQVQYSMRNSQLADIRCQAGAEYALFPGFDLRTGMDNGRWTLGAGWRFMVANLVWLQLDYALATEQYTGASLMHFFSLGIDLLPRPPKP